MTKNADEILEYAKKSVHDLVSNFLYYDRKDDDYFTREDAELLMTHPDAVEELSEEFRKAIESFRNAIASYRKELL